MVFYLPERNVGVSNLIAPFVVVRLLSQINQMSIYDEYFKFLTFTGFFLVKKLILIKHKKVTLLNPILSQEYILVLIC